MPLAPGTQLGPYEIVAPLGEGGMGEVYRAHDTRLERTVAIKVLPAQFSADPIRKQRFEREAKTISKLNHPHICVVYDVGQQAGVDYLVMECVEGETLASRLVRVTLGASVEAGAPMLLFQTHRRLAVSAQDLFSYDVSADGQRFLIANKVDEGGVAPLTVQLNWASLLEK